MPGAALDVPELLAQADQALYFAKEHGRNRVEVASLDMTVDRKKFEAHDQFGGCNRRRKVPPKSAARSGRIQPPRIKLERLRHNVTPFPIDRDFKLVQFRSEWAAMQPMDTWDSQLIQVHREDKMRKIGWLGLAALAFTVGGAAQAETVKIGVVLPFSGANADLGHQIDKAFDLYVKLHAKDIAPHKVEIIKRDEGPPTGAKAKTVTTELITRDKVLILTG